MRGTAVLLCLLLAGCSARDAEDRFPDGVAVLGDSISRATNVNGDSFGDQPIHSFATGSAPDDGIVSHFERLKALEPGLDIVPFNDARAGARIDEMSEQAQSAGKQRAEYVIVLLGANDVCAGTSPADFTASLRAGASALAPLGAQVLIASVPDVAKLVDLYGENETARAVWEGFHICPRVLAADADLDAARALVLAYNGALEAEASARGWRWDGGAVTDVVYQPGDVSTVDYFHPSLAGQARLAEVTWAAGPYAGRLSQR